MCVECKWISFALTLGLFCSYIRSLLLLHEVSFALTQVSFDIGLLIHSDASGARGRGGRPERKEDWSNGQVARNLVQTVRGQRVYRVMSQYIYIVHTYYFYQLYIYIVHSYSTHTYIYIYYIYIYVVHTYF